MPEARGPISAQSYYGVRVVGEFLEKKIRLENLTRREFRESLEAGQFRAAIIATGSIEQHLEHLALAQDINSSTYIAERVAERLYPNVIVAVPVSIGVAEHHMHSAGTLAAKPGSWLAVLFDVVESLVRHGVLKILLLNGHAKNRGPLQVALPQWLMHLENLQVATGWQEEAKNKMKQIPRLSTIAEAGLGALDVRFNSYWDLIPRGIAEEHLATGTMPGHATEFETAFTMHAFPENIRLQAIRQNSDAGPSEATAETGRILIEEAIKGTSSLVEEMLQG